MSTVTLPDTPSMLRERAVDILARPYDSLHARCLAEQVVVQMLAGLDPLIEERHP